jgi:hypothetical protein
MHEQPDHLSIRAPLSLSHSLFLIFHSYRRLLPLVHSPVAYAPVVIIICTRSVRGVIRPVYDDTP